MSPFDADVENGERLATLRLRMSAHDAHYGGNLVDGARMLALFGDLATELCILDSGDEGLFAAYDSVEFLAPVYAGDYIEAAATITRRGTRSRAMSFEARKVIAAPPEYLTERRRVPHRAARGVSRDRHVRRPRNFRPQCASINTSRSRGLRSAVRKRTTRS